MGFSLILLPGMFISYYTIIYFFVKNFFFECLYFSEYDIRMFLFVFWLRNRLSIRYIRNLHMYVYWCVLRGRGITLHVYVRTYTISFHVFVLWCLMAASHRFKGCHILYVFGLNSTVCSHIVGLHLVSWCWLILQFFTAFAYQAFLATFSVY